MAQVFHIHPDNPQQRLINQAVQLIRKGGVVVYPTDAAYAIACTVGNKNGMERISAIRQFEGKHHFTLVCRDLSELATYARVDNVAFRLLKHNTPGPYTFILQATSEVPRRLMHPNKKTIGLRVPGNRIALALLETLEEPLMSVTLIMPGEVAPLIDPEEIEEQLGKRVDLIIDGGWGEIDCTTVVDLAETVPVILRLGKGDPRPFESA